MPKTEPKTAIGLVLAILYRELGLFYSAYEIKRMVEEEYTTIIDIDTVRKAINEVNRALPLVATRTQRTGPLKLPTNLYAITISI